MKIPIILILATLGIASAGKFTNGNRPMYRKRLIINAVLQFGEQNVIFQTSEVIVQGPRLDIGESGGFNIETGMATLPTGENLQVGLGTLELNVLPFDKQAISTALAKLGLTLDQFIQQTGALSDHHAFNEVKTGRLSIGGSFMNINAGVIRIISEETLNPTDEGILTGPNEKNMISVLQSKDVPIFLKKLIFNAALIFDGQKLIYQYGEVTVRGPLLDIGDSGIFNIETGFAITETGERIQLEDGNIHILVLPTDIQVISSALTETGITLDRFIRQTGAISSQQRFLEVTSGVVSNNKNSYKNLTSGVLRLLSVEILQLLNPNGEGSSGASTGQFGPGSSGTPLGQEPSGTAPGQFEQGRFGTSPALSSQGQFGPISDQGPFGPSSGQDQFGPNSSQGQFGPITQTGTVTETAAHVTSTVSEPVTLTKTQTRDEFVTITSPVYNSIAATITNLVKATVTVPEEQVIRSPVAGGVVVKTIPVPSQTVLTVSVRTTNYFVSTVIRQDTQQYSLFVTNYSINTATVINQTTSTVVQTITQTRVATVFNTSTVGSTVFRTVTNTVNLGTGGATQPTGTAGGYNY